MGRGHGNDRTVKIVWPSAASPRRADRRLAEVRQATRGLFRTLVRQAKPNEEVRVIRVLGGIAVPAAFSAHWTDE
jgi:hypothetical protein